MRQHNDLRHISSMDISRHSHRKIIAEAQLNSLCNERSLCSSRQAIGNCSEKDTRLNKLLHCDADFDGSVMYFAVSLSKAIGKRRFRMQAALQTKFRIFFFN